MNKTCPICSKEEILSPNGVCLTCYEHLKSYEIPSREKIAIGAERRLRENYSNATKETLEKNIESAVKFHQENLDNMTKNGLKAVQLAIIVVDEAKHLPTWREWHRRHIAFIKNLIEQLPISIFAPVTKEQMNAFLWNLT